MKKIISSFIRACLCLTLLATISGCIIKPYKFDLHQGNVITPEKIKEIQPGMSESQVRYELGSPLLQDVFHGQRWDYVYYGKPRKGKVQRHHVAIHFSEGHVTRVEDNIEKKKD